MEKPVFEGYFQRLRAGARHRGIEFSISKSYIVELIEKQNYCCALTGEQIVIGNGRKGFMRGNTSASLDRVDPSKGYIEGNVQWVHKDVNRMKSNLTPERFIELCKKVTANVH